MEAEKSYIAVDLGASSGRVILGRFNGGVLRTEEVHRFENGPIEREDGYHWDCDRLFTEIKAGISKAVRAGGDGIRSIGVDSWGVDYGLIGDDGQLLAQPFSYRDPRTDGMLDKAFGKLSREEIFRQTGVQFMPINTLYQLLADRESGDSLAQAESLLLIADLFNYLLTGKRVCEHTLASTSQCFNPGTGTWATDMLEQMGIPAKIFPPIVESGSLLGNLLPELAEETGAGSMPVVAVGAHDTASAVAATPSKTPYFALMSLGTWSLLGTELSGPVMSDECLAHNFTNEGGVLGTNRLLKNATGLWIVQECRRVWKQQGRDYSFDEMADMAEATEPFQCFIDPDASEFQTPGDMPERIREFCRRTGQTVPASEGAILRAVNESLALKSRWIIERLEEISGNSLGVLHVVGGGTRNKLLLQLIANAVKRRVVAGPVEATALGNIIMQMIAMEDLQTLEEGRAMLRRSVELETYEPRGGAEWEDAFERMMEIVGA